MNQSRNFQLSSPPLKQVHNFMEDREGSLQSDVLQLQKQNMQLFWHQQLLEIDQLSDFKQHALPLARIKRVMKSNEDVKMISADAPLLFSKACELFIMELTLRSWLHTEGHGRQTLQTDDVVNSITHEETLDFLADIISGDEIHEEEESGSNGGGAEPYPFNEVHDPAMDPNQFRQN